MPQPLFQQLPQNARVLFIRLRNLGEAVLDTANLRALKTFRPDLQITTLVEGIFAELYSADPDITGLPLNREARDRRSSLRARLEILRQIRENRFDAVVNLHGGPASAQLVALSGIKERAGAEHFRFGYIYNWRIPPAEDILKRRELHTVESQFAAFHWLGLPGDEPARTSLAVDEAARRSAAQKLKDLGFDVEARFAVLAPTNEFYTKRWMPERYALIADELSGMGYQVLITGAPTDEQRDQLRSVEVRAKARTFSVSSLRISELVAVISGADLFVGNDSGPAHIAAAVRTPAVVLFGPASSVRWRPWRAQAELVQNYFPCNPCPMYTCEAFDEPECIRSITVDQVINAIERVMAQTH